MSYYIKRFFLLAFLFGISQEGMTQSPCFPGLPVTGAYATGGSSPNKERVFWLTWGATYVESITTHPYGKAGKQLNRESKSYGSIDLGGGRFMCVEAEITTLNVSGSQFQEVNSYTPGTYNGDFLPELYNIGGSGSNNRMVSGIINQFGSKTTDIVIKIKANVDGEPVRLRGMVLADAESLSANDYIYATGDGNWSVVEVKKNIGQGPYNISKQTNTYNNPPRTSETILFERGNNSKTGALAFLTYKNTAYASMSDGYAVTFSSKFHGGGITAIAIGLLTSGYDFGDAPESYGKPIHLIDDIDLGNDLIVAGGSTVNVNTSGYNPGTLSYSVKRYLGSTAPDADIDDMYSEDALGDDNSGSAGPNEEDAWPQNYKQIADNQYRPGDKITATIPYTKGFKKDRISGWIDFNLNGVFDENERVTTLVPSDGDGSVTLEWIVPPTRIAYSTYVRLRYFGSADDPKRATGTALQGEVEDHRIYIMTQGTTNPMLPSKSKQPGQ